MAQGEISLAALREELNRIDNTLHDLIMERAAIAESVAASKGDAPVWRPAREAQILRRLIERHNGPFPRAALVAIWREIISAMVRLQGEFAIAVHVPEIDRNCRGLARDHFGGEAPMAFYGSARAVLTAVQDGSASVGVLPLPEDSEEAPWWMVLAGMSDNKVSVCARLPFAPSAPGNGDGAYCVAAIPPEESESDNSLFVLRTNPQVSRARLNDAIAAAGIKPIRLISHPARHDDVSVFLAELSGFAGPEDARIARLIDPDGGIAEAAVFLGVYAIPFDAAEISNCGGV